MPAWLVGAFFLGLLVPVRLAAHQHISIAVPATREPQVGPGQSFDWKAPKFLS